MESQGPSFSEEENIIETDFRISWEEQSEDWMP